MGPDSDLFEQLRAILGGADRHEELETVPMLETDVVIVDLYRYRLNTSDYEIDERGLLDELLEMAKTNPDVRWCLVCPPHLVKFGYQVRLRLVDIVNAGVEGTEVAEDPAITDAADTLTSWRDRIREIETFALTVTESRALTPSETRAVVELLRNVDSAELIPMGGGQSEALACLVHCTKDGVVLPPRLIKIGSAQAARREHERYMDQARWNLGNSRRPDHAANDMWISGNSGALMFTFVATGGIVETLRDAMRARDVTAQVTELFGVVLKPWLSQRQASSVPVADFMRAFLEPMSLQLANEAWTPSAAPNPVPNLIDLATRVVRIDLPTAITHGDMHAMNVLIRDGAPWLIDFYQTGRRTGLFDFAFADVAWYLHRTQANGPTAVECSLDECREAEQRYANGGPSLRQELDVLRGGMITEWGTDALALFQLARACAALRHLHWPFADYEKAKWIAHIAYEHVRTTRPEWWQAPATPTIEFA